MLCKSLELNALPLWLESNKDKWVAEIKFDGDRLRLIHIKGVTKLYNRRNKEVTERYPELQSFKSPHDLVLDGEVCVFDTKGVSQFNEGIAFRTHCKSEESIASAMSNYPVTFVAFDLLECDGEDLRDVTYEQRIKHLGILKKNIKCDSLMYSEVFEDIKKAWNMIKKSNREGLILKKLDSTYRDDYRSPNWLKVKNLQEIDLEFIDYTVNPAGIRVTTENEIAIQVAGEQHYEVKEALDKIGKVILTVRHLGETKEGRYRQPTFLKMVVGSVK